MPVLALLVAAMTTGAANQPGAQAIDQLAQRYWQYELQTDYDLRAQVGMPVETIRPVSLDEADKDAAAAKPSSTASPKSTRKPRSRALAHLSYPAAI